MDKIQILQDNKNFILKDSEGFILTTFSVESDVPIISEDFITLKKIIQLLHYPILKMHHRICILNSDETVQYIIPEEDIPEDGISFSENYQNGQRKSITLKLNNINKKYTPRINNSKKITYHSNNMFSQQQDQTVKTTMFNNEYQMFRIWGDTKFSYEVGIEYKNSIIWFKKGIYGIKSVSDGDSNDAKFVTFQLVDKFGILEGNSGKLINTLEIPEGVNVYQLLCDLLNQDFGNGTVFDSKSIILDSSLSDCTIQAPIKKNVGDTIGSIISDIATQISAEYFYLDNGQLFMCPLGVSGDDIQKDIIWTYQNKYSEVIKIERDYDFENAVNIIRVVGNNIEKDVYYAIAKNIDPRSPICIGEIGKRIGDQKENSNIWSQTMAQDLANYYLRDEIIQCLKLSLNVKFNPLLALNYVIELENNYFNIKREKYLINSISYSSNSIEMNIGITDLKYLSDLQIGSV